MRGRKWIYIRAGARVGGRGAGGKSLWACTGCGLGQGRAPAGRREDAAGDDWWKKAQTDGRGHGWMYEARTCLALTGEKARGRVGEVQTRRALTSGKRHGCVGPEAISSRKNSNERDHRDRARTGVGTHTTTAMRTRVRVRTDGHRAQVRTGAGWNGRWHYASACGNRRGARGYERRGINKTPTD
jgi:hypothetical protein